MAVAMETEGHQAHGAGLKKIRKSEVGVAVRQPVYGQASGSSPEKAKLYNLRLRVRKEKKILENFREIVTTGQVNQTDHTVMANSQRKKVKLLSK